ncbi:MAG: 1-acyl-sn-glycerol-3-phosphate acyltransferase [Lachnospiraceae bacterium]|nr:1-acyl-sn-glycerol-3-phosphate acyltransferase [Lachnospiraceae bacterium]
MGKEKTYYYSDLLNDDFAGTHIKTICVDKDFPYLHKSVLWRGAAKVLYFGVAIPVIWIISKIYLGLKIENRKVIRNLSGKGFFLYGNHTREADAFVSPMVTFPQKSYVIAGADAVSLPELKNIVQMLGVIPIPTVFNGMKNFFEEVSKRCREGYGITIYPEAHIWPYYTKIRPFSDISFRYPVKENAPSVAMVVTYRKRSGLFRFLKKPGMTVTLSEPIYPDRNITEKAAQEKLRDCIFMEMTKIANSREQVEYIHYEYAPEKCK